MIDKAFTCPHVRARLRRNLFGDLLDEYVAQLLTRGYARHTIRLSLGAVEHFGFWIGTHGHSPSGVNAALVHSFLQKHLSRYRCPQGQRALWVIWVDLRPVWSVRIPSFVVCCYEARRTNDGKVSARVPG